MPFKDEEDYNEYDLQCDKMSKEDLLNILNDPNADESLKQAALAMLARKHDIEIMEDAYGNRILVNSNGEPLLDSSGKPIQIKDDMLTSLGAQLGDPEELNIDPSMQEKLNILANMCKGLSEEDAKKEY